MYAASDSVLSDLKKMQHVLNGCDTNPYHQVILLNRMIDSLIDKIRQDRAITRSRRASIVLPFEVEEVAQ